MEEQNNNDKADAAAEASQQENEAQSAGMIKAANLAAARLEKANKRLEANLARQEALAVKETLGGEAETNIDTAVEETEADYAKKVLANEIGETENKEQK
jgi:hypothetical protein